MQSQNEKKSDKDVLISLVLPTHNEEQNIDTTIRKIHHTLSDLNFKHEIIIVDDGSQDTTFELVSKLRKEFNSLKGIQLSRNFGKESALLAGLRAAGGDAVITIDADLQHPPTIIPEMIAQWKGGLKIVHAVKKKRKNDSLFTRWRAAIFSYILNRLGGIEVHNSSDFKLLDRIAVNVIVKELCEHKRFYRGLADWVGFEQGKIYFEPAVRHVGESKWSLKALVGYAITGIVSFTSAPLRIVTVLGLLTLLFAFGVCAEALWSWHKGTAVSGFVTLIITVLLVGSFIMISLGVLGEYIARIYDEIKGRPDYIIERTSGFDDNV